MAKKDTAPDTTSEGSGDQGKWVILYAGPASGAEEPTYRGIIEVYGDPLRYEDPAMEAQRVALVQRAQDGLDRLLGIQPAQQTPTHGNR